MALRSRYARQLAAVSLSAVSLAACNLLTGLDADYRATSISSALTDGGDAANVRGSDAKTNALPDANGDGGQRRFCDLQRDGSADGDFVCEDFEAPTTADQVPPGWTVLNDPGYVKPKQVDGGGVDGSTGLECGPLTKLIRKITPSDPTAYSRYSLDFDVRVESATHSYQALGLLAFAPSGGFPSKEHGLVSRQQTGSYLSRPANVASDYPPPDTNYRSASVNEWRHLSVVLAQTSVGEFSRKILLAGASIDEPAKTHALVNADPTQLWFGVFNLVEAGSAKVYFDNIVFRRTPK